MITQFTRTALARAADEMRERYVCPICFPSDDLRGRKSGACEYLVEIQDHVVRLVAPFYCGKGHFVRAEKTLNAKPRATTRRRNHV